MQNKILSFSFDVRYNFRLFNAFRKLAIISFFSRLKIVNHLFFGNRNLFVSSYRKLQLVFSLRKRFNSKKLRYIYFSKCSGNSLLFNFPEFYERSFLLLFNFYTLPFLEKFYNRFSYSYRPYRLYNDIFYFFKKDSFFYRASTYYYSIVEFSINYNPLNFFLYGSDRFFTSRLYSRSFGSENYEICNNLFNFSFIGLVQALKLYYI